ncbi:MAG TPA: GDSL-type esterase/lipase family protein [Bryobacteraceae bacterium]|nr:GDSL-type esterase/lipase family protein [Bryobacteraceae bacterium]
MKILPRVGCAVLITVGVCLGAADTTPAKKPTSKSTPARKAKSKKYLSSVGKPAPKTAPVAATKTPVKTAAKKVVSTTRRIATPRFSPATRMEASQGVFQKVANGAEIPVQNAGTLIPFFEQLYRHQKGEMPGPLRILHYGDSHTAADEWTGDLRSHFQEKFGDGGSGYSLIGRPYAGYRRFDVRSGSTRGWHTEGLVGKAPGDGIYGLGGISMSTRSPRESVYLLADCSQFELFYLQQPGGGSLQIYDNGNPVERLSTDGTPAPGYYHYEGVPGQHRFEVETLDHAPVRLFGWVAENSRGVTYEELGINGAQASISLNWDEEVLKSNIERRNPALIVLAYGTNEAGRKDQTVETYRDMFVELIGRFRKAAPTATILIIGPPDRFVRTRSKGWIPLDNIDLIVAGQREAAAATGCAFWDLRAKMGGKGAMKQWVQAGMAQSDYVHFTGAGYRMIGDAVFRDLMGQYEIFLKARESVSAAAAFAADAVIDRH